MNRYFSLFVVIVLAILSHLVIFVQAPLLWQTGAVLLLAGLLPGTLLVEWLVGESKEPPTGAERVLYSIGASYTIMVVVMLLVSYLPGAVARWQTFLAFDLVLLLGLLLCGWARRGNALRSPKREDPPTRTTEVVTTGTTGTTGYWVLAGVLSLALVGGFFRLVNLDYSEFQGDEARATLRAAAVIQGYEDVLLIHKKGPTEILVPTVIYSMTEHLNEQTARLPFALANLAGLFALFLLGWRLFGPVAGWTAAMLLAFDGYFIGFSRIVQYQSVVFLTGVLVVLILHRLWRSPEAVGRYLTLAACLFATGFLSHYDAVWVVLPAIYLLWQLARQVGWLGLLKSVVVPVCVGIVALGSFFLPFVQHPAFTWTYRYLADDRIGGSVAGYNNVADFFVRTTLYSSTYYVLLLILLTLVAWLRHVQPFDRLRATQRFGGGSALLGRVMSGSLVAIIILGLIATAQEWLIVGGWDLTGLFFALVLGSALIPRVSGPRAAKNLTALASHKTYQEEQMIWLWFSVPLLFALFLTADPSTHVYVFFMPWVLLAGMVVEQGWQAVSGRIGEPRALLAALPLACVIGLLFGGYAYWYFIYNEVEILPNWHESRPNGYWTVYEYPNYSSIFGFPHQVGWKVIGSLYESGVLAGAYDTNPYEDDDWVREWYTRGAALRCERTHRYFLQPDNLDWVKSDPSIRAQISEKVARDYQPIGTVLVHEQPRLRIYERTESQLPEQPFDRLRAPRFEANEYVSHFDDALSDPYFKINFPVTQAVIQQSSGDLVGVDRQWPLRLGEVGSEEGTIWLEGYQIANERVRPGETVQLTLYWRATAKIAEQYSVFNHITEPGVAIYGQLDGQPGCESKPTDKWKVGELIADHYDIPLSADTPAGSYPLLIGMYQLDTLERLNVYDSNDQPLGNFVELTKIMVEP